MLEFQTELDGNKSGGTDVSSELGILTLVIGGRWEADLEEVVWSGTRG